MARMHKVASKIHIIRGTYILEIVDDMPKLRNPMLSLIVHWCPAE